MPKRVLLFSAMMLVLCAVVLSPVDAGEGQVVARDPEWCEELYFVAPESPWPCRSSSASDRDGDGVSDGRDKCPDTPSGARVEATGCPVDGDGDGDGINDGIDRCPNSPRGARVDDRGCSGDSDGDYVNDDTDQCPNTPRGTRVDARGCPADPDNDGDGVNESDDRCPGTPRGTTVGPDGCPPRVTPEPPAPPRPAAIIAPGEKVVLEGVTFATGKATLTGGSKEVLDRVVRALQTNPDVRIEVGGHTDSTGNDATNTKLAEDRAAAVRAYLIAKGVESSRIASRGYGQTQPLADNGTPEGRAKNRRVEVKRTE